MSTISLESVSNDPSFITYLLTPDLCDSFFIVGNAELVQPERIGVVKKMLLAHSVVLRSEMLAREIEQKKDILVSDTYPDTFKNLLRFVYGHDTTASLAFEEADNLLYVAEKYQVQTLMARLSTRLIQLLTPENICSLLNNPACGRVLELDSAITTILQQETNRVLASPHFLDLNVPGVVKVMEQTMMNVSEIEVWRAAVCWAKHRTNTDVGKILRKELVRPAKYIRICTIDHESFLKEVVPAGILTDKEVRMACSAKGTGTKQEDLVTFSNEIYNRTVCISKSEQLDFDLVNNESQNSFFKLLLLTKKHSLELLPLKCKGKPCPYFMGPEGVTYECKCTITISRVTNYSNNSSTEDPETIEVCQQVEYGKEFLVPFTKCGKNIVLLPNETYHVSFEFHGDVVSYCFSSENFTSFKNDYLSVGTEQTKRFKEGYSKWVFTNRLPSKSLQFRPLL